MWFRLSDSTAFNRVETTEPVKKHIVADTLFANQSWFDYSNENIGSGLNRVERVIIRGGGVAVARCARAAARLRERPRQFPQ